MGMSTVIDGSASVTINSGAVLGITSAPAQASTSGTSIDFTGIPSWVKRITVMFNGVSTGSNSNFLIQIGSGSIVTTGYVSGAVTVQSGASSSAAVTSTTAFVVATAGNAAYLWTGTVQLVNLTGNTWVECGMLVNTTGDRSTNSGGTLALGGALDRVRITSVTPDTFDAGSVNIMYEG